MSEGLDLAALSDDELKAKFAEAVKFLRDDRQENQIRYWTPTSPVAAQVFETDARVVGIGGGNRSGKTTSVLALVVACATGVFPESMKHTVDRRFRGPIRVRVICDSLTTTLYPTILPKLQWWKWSGPSPQGGERGHWGLIPPYCLKDRLWEKSWNEKLRILTLVCRDPQDPNIILGESIFHFMSYDQEEGRGTDFHYVLHDEPPPLHIWRESEARVMGVAGRMLLAMTWPDDPAIPVDWLFDEVYEPGMDPSNKEVEWINLYSTDNPHADQAGIAAQSKNWSEEMRRVRIYGQPIRFSNRIHPLFTDTTQHWCHSCGKTCFMDENPNKTGVLDAVVCVNCRGVDVCDFNHVIEFEYQHTWPVVWLLDMHPRKPHVGLWAAIDPSDDIWIVDECSVEGDPTDMKLECNRVEEFHGMNIALRLCDPNMGLSPSSSRRGITWKDAFDEAGLVCELADDAAAGRMVVNQYLKPDKMRGQPRLHVHPRCKETVKSIKRYVWDETKRSLEKEQKQTPKPKGDDQANLLKYLMNWAPTFSSLRGMHTVYHRPGTRRGAY